MHTVVNANKLFYGFTLSAHELNISFTRSMTRRFARYVVTPSEESAASSNFSLCMAPLTQAHAIAEGKYIENLQSENKWR